MKQIQSNKNGKTLLVLITQKLFCAGTNLRQRTMVAAFWAALGSGGSGVIRLISNLLLTRILFPEAFGLMATAMVLVNLVQLFSDTGVRTALIQNPRGANPEFIDSAFLITIARNIILATIIWLGSDPAAAYYQQSELSVILKILSGAVLLEGFTNPAIPILIKKLKIHRQVTYSVGSQFAGFLVTFLLAWLMQSVTALALGYLSTSLFRMVGSYLVISYQPRLRWYRKAGRELFAFGKYILINTMLAWAVINSDRIIIGKVLGMDQLAYYNIALYIGVFLSDVLVQVTAQSYFPAVSSIAGNIDKVQAVYRQTSTLVIILAAPVLMLVALYSDWIISILYDPRYLTAGSVLVWVAVRGMVNLITNLQSGTILALGKPVLVSVANGVGLVVLVAMMPLAATNLGLTGAGMVILATALIIGLLQTLFMVRYLGFSPKTVLQSWSNLLVLAATITAAHQLITQLTRLTPYPQTVSIALLGTLSGLLILIWTIKSNQLFKHGNIRTEVS